jgi:peptidoglycan/xylan/chitin deacetylase (PgdA/CDA1 family)
VVTTVKRRLRAAAQSTFATLAPMAWRTTSRRLLVLMYHRVLPAEHPDRDSEQPGMYVSPSTLAMHLEIVKQYFTLIHLDEWLERVSAGQAVPSLACAITFDDGWRDNYEYAFPILRRARAPATIYLVADMVGAGYSFWPNTLARYLGAGVVDGAAYPTWLADVARKLNLTVSPGTRAWSADEIDKIIGECKINSTDAEMRDRVGNLVAGAHASSGPDLMSWEQARAMGADDLIRFGSHTRRHTRLLPQLPEQEARDEILGSIDVISDHLSRKPRTFCYPNGDMSAVAVAAVREGYLGAVTTRRGWNRVASDNALLKRVGVHEDVSAQPSAFISRLGGLG